MLGVLAEVLLIPFRIALLILSIKLLLVTIPLILCADKSLDRITRMFKAVNDILFPDKATKEPITSDDKDEFNKKH